MLESIKEVLNREFNEPLELMISSEKETNKALDYIISKIISQLEIRKHILNIGSILQHINTEDILLEIIDNKEPLLWKKIIMKDNSKIDYISSYNINNDQRELILSHLNNNINLLVDFYYQELINNTIVKSITNDKYYGIHKEISEEWFLFYQNHENELFKWININKYYYHNINREDIERLYLEYIKSLLYYEEYISNLKKDILGNLYMMKYIMNTNLNNSSFQELLNNIRNNMKDKMIDIGEEVLLFRQYDIQTPEPVDEEDLFFDYCSKYKEIEDDINKLSVEYKLLNNIEDKELYIRKTVKIFQDFIRIHPYQNGNGRTSRLLLDSMLKNKIILPPVLYKTYYQRRDLDNPSREYTIKKDIEPIIKFVEERIQYTNEKYKE